MELGEGSVLVYDAYSKFALEMKWTWNRQNVCQESQIDFEIAYAFFYSWLFRFLEGDLIVVSIFVNQADVSEEQLFCKESRNAINIFTSHDKKFHWTRRHNFWEVHLFLTSKVS